VLGRRGRRGYVPGRAGCPLAVDPSLSHDKGEALTMGGMVCTGAGASGWVVVGVGRRAVGRAGPPTDEPAIATGGGADLATATGGRPGLAHARAGARRRQKHGTPAQGPRSVGPSPRRRRGGRCMDARGAGPRVGRRRWLRPSAGCRLRALAASGR